MSWLWRLSAAGRLLLGLALALGAAGAKGRRPPSTEMPSATPSRFLLRSREALCQSVWRHRQRPAFCLCRVRLGRLRTLRSGRHRQACLRRKPLDPKPRGYRAPTRSQHARRNQGRLPKGSARRLRRPSGHAQPAPRPSQVQKADAALGCAQWQPPCAALSCTSRSRHAPAALLRFSAERSRPRW